MKKRSLRPFRLADFVRDRIPGQLAASADGRFVAMVIGESSGDPARQVSRIWLLDEAAAEGARPVTAADKQASLPAFSPDGRHLAYLSEVREGISQLAVLSAPFSHPRVLTRFTRGVRAFDWSPDGKRLVVLAPADLPAARKKAIDRKDDARDVEADEPRVRMWIVQGRGGKPAPLGPTNRNVTAAAWSPDGRRVAFVSSEGPGLDEGWRGSDLRLLAIDGKRARVLKRISSASSTTMVPAFSPDGARIAITDSPRRGQLGPDHVYVVDCRTARATRLDRRADRIASSPRWLDNDTVVFLRQEGVRRILRAAPASGRPGRTVFAGAGYVHEFCTVPGGGSVFLTYSENDKAPEVFSVAARAETEARCLTQVNRRLGSLRHFRGEIAKWKSREGWEIEGLFFRPAARFKPPYATVVIPHGGPHGAANNAHDPQAQVYCTRGYAVFRPNFRGSIGYGEAFLRAIHRDWGAGPADDILRGVRALVRKRLADPTRLVLHGGSYGGYMTAWLIGHTRIFAAAVAHAPVVNNVSMWGTTDIPSFMEWSFGGGPAANFGRLWDQSPVKYISRCTTPTLVLVGEKDLRVPPGQAQELHRALKAAGVPTGLVVFPREAHGIAEPLHKIDVLRRCLAWFRAHLKGRSPER